MKILTQRFTIPMPDLSIFLACGNLSQNKNRNPYEILTNPYKSLQNKHTYTGFISKHNRFRSNLFRRLFLRLYVLLCSLQYYLFNKNSAGNFNRNNVRQCTSQMSIALPPLPPKKIIRPFFYK